MNHSNHIFSVSVSYQKKTGHFYYSDINLNDIDYLLTKECHVVCNKTQYKQLIGSLKPSIKCIWIVDSEFKEETLLKDGIVQCNTTILKNRLHYKYPDDLFIFTSAHSWFFNMTTTIHLNINKEGNKERFEFDTCDWKIVESTERRFIYKRYIQTGELQYLETLKAISQSNLQPRPDRTGVGTKGFFGGQLKFDIQDSIPLFTTKYVPYKTVIKELLWFLKGDINVKTLQDQNVHIWDDNTSRTYLDSIGKTNYPENNLMYGYGHQIRRFGSGEFDQLQYIENLLQVDPYSRRIFWSLWNADQLDLMVLPPCHVSVQFYVDTDKMLSCHLYQRSVDLFLGFPFNIFSYSVLTYLLAKRHNLKPKELIISTGDTHLYMNHLEQVETQLARNARPFPRLKVNSRVIGLSINDVSVEDFELEGYFPHPSIKAKMAV